MLSIFLRKPLKAPVEAQQVPVEVIHKEVDELTDKLVNKLLEDCNIQVPEPSEEERLIRKANLMKSLGFSNENEIIHKLEREESLISDTKEKIKNAELLYNTFLSIQKQYPNDKIVSKEDFEKVLEKYNLVYAPASCYIKDVPEKNLIEIEKSGTTSYRHQPDSFRILTSIKFYNDISKKEQNKILEVLADKRVFKQDSYISLYEVGDIIHLNEVKLSTRFSNIVSSVDCEKVNRATLMIAAPRSHFNLKNGYLSDKYEYVKGKELKVSYETRDPIAFHIIKSDNIEYIRISSKWGTDDDQSYLDPLVN